MPRASRAMDVNRHRRGHISIRFEAWWIGLIPHLNNPYRRHNWTTWAHMTRSIPPGSLGHDDPEDDVDEEERYEPCQEYKKDKDQPDKGWIHVPLLGHAPADTSKELVVDCSHQCHC